MILTREIFVDLFKMSNFLVSIFLKSENVWLFQDFIILFDCINFHVFFSGSLKLSLLSVKQMPQAQTFTTSMFCHAHALKWIGHVTCSWKCSWKAVTCVIALVAVYALCSGSVWMRYPEISRLHRLFAATYKRDLILPGGNTQKTHNQWCQVNKMDTEIHHKERSSPLHTLHSPFPNCPHAKDPYITKYPFRWAPLSIVTWRSTLGFGNRFT